MANVLGRMVGFIMLPFYAHIFETEGYGILGMMEGSVGFLSIAFGSAVHNAILRTYHARTDSEEKQQVISTSIWLTWIIGGMLVLLPLYFSAYLSGLLLGSPEYQLTMVLALLTFVLNVTDESASAFLVIKQWSVLYSAIGLVRLFLALSLNILFVIVLKIGVVGVFWSSLITAVVCGLLVHSIALWRNGIQFSNGRARDLLAFWLPLIPGDLLAYVGRQAERFFVRFMVSLEAVGVLEIAYKFPQLLVYFFSSPFRRAWGTKSFEIAEEQGAPGVMGQMLTNFVFVMLFASLLLMVNIDALIRLLTPPEFWESVRIARVEIGTVLLTVVTDYFLFGLLYVNSVQLISVIKGTMAATKVVISGAFIAALGLQGAAYSALLVQFVTLLWVYYKAQQCYRIDVQYKKLWPMVIAALALAGAVTNIEYAGSELFRTVQDALLEPLINGLETKLSDGEADETWVDVIESRQEQLVALVCNSVMVLPFGIFVFVVRPELGKRVWRRLRRRLMLERQ